VVVAAALLSALPAHIQAAAAAVLVDS